MKIAFYSPHLSLRGTEVAMYDYAHYNETILGNKSIIIYHPNARQNHPSTIEKFENRFEVYELVGPEFDFGWQAEHVVPLLDKVLLEEGCDAVYMQKGGKNDGVVSRVCRTLILCCSNYNDPHGDRYAYVSHWLSKINSDNKLPVVPAMIDLPDTKEDLRAELGIPKEATVFGRTGGMDTWNLGFSQYVVASLVSKRDDIYFVFQNTPKFFNHKNIIHIPSTSDMEYKVKFINTCDAMLHARYEGESFGQTCGEFSKKNKPVITWSLSRERSHIEILGEKGIYYETPQDLYYSMFNFVKEPDKDWNCYRDYSPEKVMNKFKEIFLD